MQYDNDELYEGEWLKDKHHGQGLLLLGTDMWASLGDLTKTRSLIFLTNIYI